MQGCFSLNKDVYQSVIHNSEKGKQTKYIIEWLNNFVTAIWHTFVLQT